MTWEIQINILSDIEIAQLDSYSIADKNCLWGDLKKPKLKIRKRGKFV